MKRLLVFLVKTDANHFITMYKRMELERSKETVIFKNMINKTRFLCLSVHSKHYYYTFVHDFYPAFSKVPKMMKCINKVFVLYSYTTETYETLEDLIRG